MKKFFDKEKFSYTYSIKEVFSYTEDNYGIRLSYIEKPL